MLGEIHGFVEDASDGDVILLLTVSDDVVSNFENSATGCKIIARFAPDLEWIFSENLEGFVELIQIQWNLFLSPLF